MALHQRADGTGTINKVDATWWNEYYELLTGTMTDQPVDLGNTLSVKGKTWLYPQTAYGSTFPTITLGIGDNDSGIDWLGDGHLQLKVNGGAMLDAQNGKGVQLNAYDGATPRLIRIYIGTSAPVAPNEGDIWIKG